jgi:hypothetical protein
MNTNFCRSFVTPLVMRITKHDTPTMGQDAAHVSALTRFCSLSTPVPYIRLHAVVGT